MEADKTDQMKNTELTTKEKIIQAATVNEKVRSRPGMKAFLNYLEESGFYKSPASTKFHGSYFGGLADHSYNLYCEFSDYILLSGQMSMDFDWDSIFICAIGHDICKIDLYLGMHKPFGYNKEHPIGHAQLSITLLRKFFTLTDAEVEVIKYHMGVYATSEFKKMAPYITAEYDLKQMIGEFNRNKIVKLFHYMDDLVSQFVDK